MKLSLKMIKYKSQVSTWFFFFNILSLSLRKIQIKTKFLFHPNWGKVTSNDNITTHAKIKEEISRGPIQSKTYS